METSYSSVSVRQSRLPWLTKRCAPTNQSLPSASKPEPAAASLIASSKPWFGVKTKAADRRRVAERVI